MTDRASKAYACVAFRIMIYEGTDMTEENFAILIEDLYDFYTAKEIQKIYKWNRDLRKCHPVTRSTWDPSHMHVPNLTLLLIPCCACRQEPNMAVLRGSISS